MSRRPYGRLKRSSRYTFTMANRTDLYIVEEFSAFSVYQNEERSHDIMLSVWPPALNLVELCPLSSAAYDSLGAEKTCTQRAETRPAFPSLRRQVDAGHLSV